MRLSTLLLLFACDASEARPPDATAAPPTTVGRPLAANEADALFAGGCFWCMESTFEAVPGVLEVESGYSGGSGPATYHLVGTGLTGHAEVVRVIYDTTRIDYEGLLKVFWRNVDPTQANGQFCDRGNQYRSAIFPATQEERKKAEASLVLAEQELQVRVNTQIVDRGAFTLAEAYHQDYYKKNPEQYLEYRQGCRRDARLEELWGEPAPGH